MDKLLENLIKKRLQKIFSWDSTNLEAGKILRHQMFLLYYSSRRWYHNNYVKGHTDIPAFLGAVGGMKAAPSWTSPQHGPWLSCQGSCFRREGPSGLDSSGPQALQHVC